MRKKQLYAILLAGALAAGTVPSAVWAAEDTAAVSAAAENGAGAQAGQETENSGQQAEETPAADNTVTAAPAEPTQTPAEATQAPVETPVAEETPAADNTVTETPAQPEDVPETQQTEPQAAGDPAEDTGISIKKTTDAGTETIYYQSLQEAVDAVQASTGAEGEAATVIEVTKQLALSNTVNISGKKVCITAAANVSVGRGDSGDGTLFGGDMFSVSGANSELQLSVREGCSMTVDGGGTDSSGTIVRVGEGGAFGLFQGVILTNNNSFAAGGAVTNEGGSVVIQGGTITGNKGEKGAVYTNTDIAVQGSVTVKDNSGVNLYLDNNAAVVITGAMTGSAVSLTAANAADQRVVLKAGTGEDQTPVSQEDFKAAAEQFTYDTADYTIALGTDGTTAALKAAASVSATPTPTVSPVPTTTPAATPVPTQSPSVTPTTSPSFLSYQSGSLKWVNHSTISVGMSTTKNCKWYYFFVNADTSVSQIQEMYDSSRAVNSAAANTTFTINVENVPEEDSWLVVAAKPDSGNVQMRVLKLDSDWFKKKRPAASSTTSRAPKTHSVTESTVTGLEEPLKFYPSTFYEFQVTGAGQNDSAPYVTGDERWIPLYWSTSQNPTDNQKNSTWRIGSESGIRQAATYNMYIFFKKQAYNGSEWADTDVIEYIVTQFQSAEITDEELNDWKEANNITTIPGEDDGYGTDGYGADLTATAGASSKDSGSSTKSAVSTADESPIGEMTALAALSLAAGGYILVRKRKKDA